MANDFLIISNSYEEVKSHTLVLLKSIINDNKGKCNIDILTTDESFEKSDKVCNYLNKIKEIRQTYLLFTSEYSENCLQDYLKDTYKKYNRIYIYKSKQNNNLIKTIERRADIPNLTIYLKTINQNIILTKKSNGKEIITIIKNKRGKHEIL